MNDTAGYDEVPLEFEGLSFTMQVREEPSGLAARVFHGSEKIAGLRAYHSFDRGLLATLVTRDRAFRRAVQQLHERPGAPA